MFEFRRHVVETRVCRIGNSISMMAVRYGVHSENESRLIYRNNENSSHGCLDGGATRCLSSTWHLGLRI